MKEPYIKRKLENTILRYFKAPEILAVVGPRQSGKTTMLLHIFEKLKSEAVFLSFEDKKILNLFIHEIDEFIELYVKPYKYTFIDEFHYAKKGGRILKYIVDSTKAKIIISGSSSIDLTVQAVKYLVGRIFVFSLFPLDFDEFLNFNDPNLFALYQKHKTPLKELPKRPFVALTPFVMAKIKKYYNGYAVFGGYPRVALSITDEEKKTVLKNIYNTYFLREVKDLLGLIDDYKLTQMLKALALQIGSLVQYREIGNVSELSFQSVKHYLNFLQKTFICLLVKPYFQNKRTEIVKNPKVYFFDNGLRNYIVDDFRKIDDRPDAGVLLENSLAMQLLKQEIPFKFWRSKQHSEVDFVLDLPEGKKLALEVKKSLKSSDFASKSVRDFQAKHHIPLMFCFYDQKSRATRAAGIKTTFIGMI